MLILTFVVLNYTRCGILGKSHSHKYLNKWWGGGLEVSACALKC